MRQQQKLSMQLFIACILLIIATIDVSVRAQAVRQTKSCIERKSPGPICESCGLLATCVQIAPNEWVSIPLEACNEEIGFSCNPQLGACSNETGPCFFSDNDNQADLFACTSQGFFPDPYDCQSYHMCHYVSGTLVSGLIECGGNKAFNAATGQCTLTVNDVVCQQQQYNCSRTGNTFAWPANPNYFYVCKAATSLTGASIVYPEMYRCSDGQHFNNYYCVDDNGDDDSNMTTFRPGTGTSSITTINPSSMNVCKKVGLNVDPLDCHRYYQCNTVGGAPNKHLTCTGGTSFDANAGVCTLNGKCDINLFLPKMTKLRGASVPHRYKSKFGIRH